MTGSAATEVAWWTGGPPSCTPLPALPDPLLGTAPSAAGPQPALACQVGTVTPGGEELCERPGDSLAAPWRQASPALPAVQPESREACRGKPSRDSLGPSTFGRVDTGLSELPQQTFLFPEPELTEPELVTQLDGLSLAGRKV